jgi:hypothetical protein
MLRRLSIGPLDKSQVGIGERRFYDTDLCGPLFRFVVHHQAIVTLLISLSAEMNRRSAVYLKCPGQYPLTIVISTSPTAESHITTIWKMLLSCSTARIDGERQTSCYRRLNPSSMILSSNVGVECRATWRKAGAAKVSPGTVGLGALFLMNVHEPADAELA